MLALLILLVESILNSEFKYDSTSILNDLNATDEISMHLQVFVHTMHSKKLSSHARKSWDDHACMGAILIIKLY